MRCLCCYLFKIMVIASQQCSSDMLYWTPRILCSFINNCDTIKINTFIICPRYYFLIIIFTITADDVVVGCGDAMQLVAFNYKLHFNEYRGHFYTEFFFRFTGSFCCHRTDCIRASAYV